MLRLDALRALESAPDGAAAEPVVLYEDSWLSAGRGAAAEGDCAVRILVADVGVEFAC